MAESELAMFGLNVLDKALEHIVDGVIEIRRVEEKYDSKSMLQIQKLREMQYSTKQYWYQVNAEGVAMKPRI